MAQWDFKNISRILKLITLDLPLSDPLSDLEIERIKDFIIKSYPDFSCEMIQDAFDIGITGKLGLDVNTYNQFNKAYVGKILTAYRNYIRDLNSNYNQKSEQPQMTAKELEQKTIEAKKYMDEQFQKALNDFRNTGNWNFNDYGDVWWHNNKRDVMGELGRDRLLELKKMASKIVLDECKITIKGSSKFERSFQEAKRVSDLILSQSDCVDVDKMARSLSIKEYAEILLLDEI